MSSVQDYSFTSFFSSSRWTSFLCVGLPILSVGAVVMMLIWRKQTCYCGKPEVLMIYMYKDETYAKDTVHYKIEFNVLA